MFGRRWLAGLMAAALAAGLPCAARAETVATEYLVSMTPDEIIWLETRLSGLGYLQGEADAIYDADTRLALESFQQANGLEVSGQFDELTRQRLDSGDALSRQDYLRRFTDAYREMEPLRNGDINGQVQVMQRKLAEYGYFTGGADGVFGDATQSAVERFQMVNGLAETGIADGMTIMRLMADVPITWQGFLSEMSAAAGDVGLNVYTLQRKLTEMGYFQGDCTGSFSDMTQQAVTQFQADNGLEETGIADAGVWALIYSGGAVTRRRDDAILPGDSGDRVLQIQQQLAALGYYAQEPSGSFDFPTETALRLFQMGGGLSATGEADPDTLSLLMGGAAPSIDDETVRRRLDALLEGRSEAVQSVIAGIAGQLLGEAFDARDDALYPGFALAQYVCVAAGLPVTQPETLIRLATEPVASASEVSAGNIVAMQTTGGDSVTMLLTIGAGEGRVIYATPDTGWVVMSYIDQMDSASIYRWTEGVETVS